MLNIGDLRNGYKILSLKDRKKILLLSDDMRLASGIGRMSLELVKGTCHKYSWIQIAAAIEHPDLGKAFDLSDEMSKKTGVPHSYVKVYPNSGYGNPDLLRRIIHLENPDIIMHFTDPRQWEWLYQMEHEIRQTKPIIYYNIWDCPPAPMYNRDFYRSCDLIMNISKQTHALVKRVLENNNNIDLDEQAKIKYQEDCTYLSYVPHGINEEEFYPIKSDNELLLEKKKELFKGKDYKFVVFWNNRNIRRKMPGDLIIAFKDFVDGLPEKEKKEVALLMHTAPIDKAGTNLIALIEALAPDYQIILDGKKVPIEQLNLLYNLADITVNIASNEGFGLSSLESLMSGKMILNNVTGGLQDQVRFEDEKGKWWLPTEEIPSNHHGMLKKHGEWALTVFPKTRSMVGSIPTPYILDDRCNFEDVTLKLREAYDMGEKERIRRGLLGRKWVIGNESMMSSKKMGENFIKNVDNLMNVWKPKKTFKLYTSNERTIDRPVTYLNTVE